MSTEECKPMRQKYWGELSQEQKIERLSDLLYNLLSQQESLRGGLRDFTRHKHMPNGEIVTPLGHNSGALGVGGSSDFDMLRREKE